MANIHGSFGVLWIDDQAGTCRNMTGDVTSITFNRTKNLAEVTTMGSPHVQRIDGLRDATMDVTGLFSTCGTAAAVIGLLDNMYSNSALARVQYFPAGSISGCPVYTASMRMSNYSINQPIDGPVAVNFSLAATTAITAACVT